MLVVLGVVVVVPLCWSTVTTMITMTVAMMMTIYIYLFIIDPEGPMIRQISS